MGYAFATEFIETRHGDRFETRDHAGQTNMPAACNAVLCVFRLSRCTETNQALRPAGLPRGRRAPSGGDRAARNWSAFVDTSRAGVDRNPDRDLNRKTARRRCHAARHGSSVRHGRASRTGRHGRVRVNSVAKAYPMPSALARSAGVLRLPERAMPISISVRRQIRRRLHGYAWRCPRRICSAPDSKRRRRAWGPARPGVSGWRTVDGLQGRDAREVR